MSSKRVGSVLIGVVALIGLVGCALVYLHLRAAEENLAQVPTRRVLVATRDIPAQSRIELNAVTTASISEEAVPARPIVRVEDVIGRFAREPISRGDILTENRVVSLEAVRRDVAAGIPPPAPSLLLERDQVLFIWPTRLAGAFAGPSQTWVTEANASRRGDYVDITISLLEFPPGLTAQQRQEVAASRPWELLRTALTVQSLPVMNVGPFPDPSSPQQVSDRPEERYLALVVDRNTALQLKWLKDLIGLGQAHSDLMLRASNDLDVEPLLPLGADDMRTLFGLFGPGDEGALLAGGEEREGVGGFRGVAATQAGVPIIPEADTLWLLLGGLLGLGGLAYWRRR